MIIADTDAVFTPRCQPLAHVTTRLLNISYVFIPPLCLGKSDMIHFSNTIPIAHAHSDKNAILCRKQARKFIKFHLQHIECNSDHLTEPVNEHSNSSPSAFSPKNFYFPSGSTMKLILLYHLLLSLNRMKTENSLSTTWVPLLFHNLICFITILMSQSTA